MTSSASGGCGAARPSSRPLRRGHHRRRLPRPRDRLLPARKHGITDVGVLEKCYIGSGAAGRNTTILRSNYKTPEGARFYDASVKLYEGLSAELDFNLLFTQCGPPDPGPLRPGDVRDGQPGRGQPAGRDRLARDRPRGGPGAGAGDVRRRPTPTYPIMGALYHPPGGIIRHDAVVWGFARGADEGGRRDPPLHRGHRDRARRRPGRRR